MKRHAARLLYNLFPRSHFALAVAELFILVFAYTLGLHIFYAETSYLNNFLIALFWSTLIITSMMVIGLYWRDQISNVWQKSLKIFISFLVGCLIFSVAHSIFSESTLFAFDSNIFLLVTSAGFLSILVLRSIFYTTLSQDFMKKRFLVIGAGVKASQLFESDMSEVNFVGFIPFSDKVIKLPDEQLVTHSISLVGIAEEYDVDGIIVALDERRNKFPLVELFECKMKGIKILELTEFFETHRKQLNVNNLTPSSIIFSHGFRSAIIRGKSKRIFDLLASTALIILSLPVLLIASIAILIEGKGKGPIFYHQTRVGKDDIPFKLYKLRSMCVDAEKQGVQWASKNDPRVTKVGHILRKYRIDELPQLLNVLKGEMSFVGPRPERPVFVKDLVEQIPYYKIRHVIKPGITGWAQICYPYGDSVEDAKEKLQYDLYYIKNYNLLLDLNIIFQTVHTVIWRRGSR